jgi:hypothetical protein
VADTSKENRAASILLAGMAAVDQLSQALLGGVGQRLGKRATVHCYTEVVPKLRPEGSRLRPDGLIVVKIGSRTWSALVEAKIARAQLNPEQIEAYLQLAKLNGINAVITISNQFAALPTHHPVTVPRSLRRGVELYHWSWMHVRTQATLVAKEGDFTSSVQRFVLDEMVRYYEHDSVGVFGFDRMNPEWKELVLKVQSGGTLARTKPEVTNSVAAWHQETRDLALIMSRKVGSDVTLRLTNKHKTDPALRLKDDSEQLAKTATLDCALEIPNAVAPLEVSVDLRRRVVTCKMRIDAPKDKKTARARIGWILRQLGGTEPSDVFVSAIWPGRAARTQCSLEAAKADPQLLEAGAPGLKPNAFEVLLVRAMAGRMSGAKTFIEDIEKAVPEFYKQAGQRLQAWVAPPPKIMDMAETEPEAELQQPPAQEPATQIPTTLDDQPDGERKPEPVAGGIPDWQRRT